MEEKKLAWKRELSAVMDNPDWIEEKMDAIKMELKKEHPDTRYLREKIKSMETWTHEIDLAHERARQRAGKVV
jgi:hypothetical protein